MVQSRYNIVDYIPCAVRDSLMTYRLHNWKLVPLTPLHLFPPDPRHGHFRTVLIRLFA